MKRIEIMDYLKGYAIFTIVLMHLIQRNGWISPWFQTLASIGGTGVHVFVFCSGFGLMFSSLKKPLSYAKFLKKRFSSVYIQYIAVILISTLITFTYTGNDRIQAVLSHLFLYKMFISRYINSFGGQFWFVSMIFQFYFAFYILKNLYMKLKKKFFFMICLIASVAWWIFVACIGKDDERVWISFFLQYLWEFSLGMLLAGYCFEGKDIKLPSNPVLAVTAVIGIATGGGMALAGNVFRLFNDIPLSIGYVSLAVLVYQCGFNPVRKLFIWINGFSYSWYLTHILVFICIARLPGIHYVVKFAVSFLLSVAVAVFYEKAYIRAYRAICAGRVNIRAR